MTLDVELEELISSVKYALYAGRDGVVLSRDHAAKRLEAAYKAFLYKELSKEETK